MDIMDKLSKGVFCCMGVLLLLLLVSQIYLWRQRQANDDAILTLVSQNDLDCYSLMAVVLPLTTSRQVCELIAKAVAEWQMDIYIIPPIIFDDTEAIVTLGVPAGMAKDADSLERRLIRILSQKHQPQNQPLPAEATYPTYL